MIWNFLMWICTVILCGAIGAIAAQILMYGFKETWDVFFGD